MLQLLKENHIIVGKSPASCSAICQASDVSPFFKTAKGILKKIHDIQWQDDDLKIELHQCIKNNKKDLSDEKRRKIVDALQKITYAVKNSLDSRSVRLGYEICGQQPLNFDNAMRATCKNRVISQAEYETMKAAVPILAESYREKGFLTEEEMDDLHIPNFNEECYSSVPKDQRALHQQRAVVMNADELLSHIRQLKEKKVQAEQARKRQAELKAAKKKAESQEKQDYNRWFTNLTPNEQARERRRIREANRQTKLNAFQPPVA